MSENLILPAVKIGVVAYLGFGIVSDLRERRQVTALFIDKGYPQYGPRLSGMYWVSVAIFAALMIAVVVA